MANKDIFKASITDWIQALAVTIAIAFATWEFVLHDRAQEQLKKEAVLQLIINGQNESISNSSQQLLELFQQLQQTADAPPEDWQKLQAVYFPVQSYLSAWGFCYHNDMCDQALTEAYICKNLVDFDQFRAMVNNKANTPNFTREEGYAALLKVCQAKP